MKRIAYFFLPLALALLGLSACKEDDNTVEEFPNWQARNETYLRGRCLQVAINPPTLWW